MRRKLELEYLIRTSVKALFTRISTAEGLTEWFADRVFVVGNVFKFQWDKSEEDARLVSLIKNISVRFQWINSKDPEEYFEFKIDVDEVTGDVALLITDFVDEDDVEDSTELWNLQVQRLSRLLGK